MIPIEMLKELGCHVHEKMLALAKVNTILKREPEGHRHQGTGKSLSKSSRLSYIFVETVPLLTDKFKPKNTASILEEFAFF